MMTQTQIENQIAVQIIAAYSWGFKAGCEGAFEDENPYAKNTPMFKEWQDGFEDGEDYINGNL